jgi:hypothetical protein
LGLIGRKRVRCHAKKQMHQAIESLENVLPLAKSTQTARKVVVNARLAGC